MGVFTWTMEELGKGRGWEELEKEGMVGGAGKGKDGRRSWEKKG